MKSEDLFAAIGGVESSRLERSELTVNQSSRNTHEEETKMYQKNHRRLFPNIMVAILIVAMLATTVFAAVGFILFDNPKQMIDTLFGNNTGYDNADWSVPDNKGDVAAEYHSDRTPVDDSIAEELAPQAEAVGQSITYAGHTLTVDANLYDAATKCGFVTYTIENPNGIRSYNVGPTGEISFPYGELLNTNQYGKSYIIQEKCTDTTLCATYYYQTRNPQNSDLEMRISFWAAVEDPKAFMGQPVEDAMKYTDSEEKIVIPAKTSSEIHNISFGNDAVMLSPFSVHVNLQLLTTKDYSFVKELKLTFKDGTEYVVKDDNTLNCLFEVGNENSTEATMMMNRLVDVDNVVSITVNGSEMSLG